MSINIFPRCLYIEHY